jgi:C-terminal processing protease CtpA/Prc
MSPVNLTRATAKALRKYAMPCDIRKPAARRAIKLLTRSSPKTFEAAEKLVRRTLAAVNRHSFLVSVVRSAASAARVKRARIKKSAHKTSIEIPSQAGTEIVRPVRQAIEHAQKTGRQIEIDIRKNRGGDMRPYLLAMLPLLPAGTPLAGIRTTTSTTWIIQGSTRLKFSRVARPARSINLSQVTVLVSRKTASSAEILALALGSYGAKIIGNPTAGMLTSNISIPVSCGAKYILNITNAKIVATKNEYIST